MASAPEERDTSAVRVLVVGDDAAARAALAACLREVEIEVYSAPDVAAAISAIEDRAETAFDVIVSAIDSLDRDGLALLRSALARDMRTRVVLMASGADVETAVSAMRCGAFDFIPTPIAAPELESRMQSAIDGIGRRKRLVEPADVSAAPASVGSEVMIAESPAMREVVELARSVASLRSTVLITGETGTGKEVIASFIHAHSPRSAGPFVKVNCAALPETLLESELFGHERGAFTGAEQQRRGRFEEASGGTLLLDEIAETSSATQAKLLRVLQDQEFHPLGGTQLLRTDARVIAATNCDLRRAVSEGRFRQDLFFRLNVIEIHLPPLRERPRDARVLAQTYLRRFASEQGRPERKISDVAMEHIVSHPWPGNVRQLRNAMERVALLARGPQVEVEDLRLEGNDSSASQFDGLLQRGITLAEMEREFVEGALRRTAFVQKDAAAMLGVSRRKLNYMIQRMGITHPSWRRNR